MRQSYTQIPHYVKELSRKLRFEQTTAEKTLWEIIRNRKFYNLKFRRQHAIGRYIADFYCDEKKVVIELDGEIHNNSKEYDAIRDEIISSHGIHIIRLENHQVLQDISEVYSLLEYQMRSFSLLWGERIQEWGFVWKPGDFLKLDKKTYGVICADKKILLLHQVKPEWKKSMDIVSFVNGNKEVLN